MENTKKKRARRAGRIRTSGVGQDAAKALAVRVPFRVDKNLLTVQNQVAGHTSIVALPTGPYTYKNIAFGIEVGAEIVGKTFAVGGKHYVNTADLSDYIGNVELYFDGIRALKYDVAELMRWAELFGHTMVDGFANLSFGGPNWFDNRFQSDAYLLGTADVRSVQLHIELKAAWAADMNLVFMPEFAAVGRPLAFTTGHNVLSRPLPSAGKHTITDLPYADDIAMLWIQGAGAANIESLRLEIDKRLIFEGDRQMLKFQNGLYGKDIAALGDDLLIDFWRMEDANDAIAELTMPGQVRRQASLRLELDVTAASDVEIKVVTCGLWRNQLR